MAIDCGMNERWRNAMPSHQIPQTYSCRTRDWLPRCHQ